MTGFIDSSAYTRRLPLYLLIDTSASMQGDAIEAVNTGVSTLISSLLENPHTFETVHLCIITFGGEAKMFLPLTEIGAVSVSRFEGDGQTPLGGALQILNTSLDRDVIKNDSSRELKGDWRPLVFLLTDGQPNDPGWEEQVRNTNERFQRNKGNIVAIGCGAEADKEVLKMLSPNPLYMKDMSTENFMELFKWISSTTKVVTKKATQMAQDHSSATEEPIKATVPPLPRGIEFLL